MFGYDSLLQRGLTILADLVLLNVSFLLTAATIVGIGPGLNSLCAQVQAMAREEGSHHVRGYWRGLRDNWLPAMGWGLAVTGGLGLAGYELLVIGRATAGAVQIALAAAVVSGIFVIISVASWYFGRAEAGTAIAAHRALTTPGRCLGAVGVHVLSLALLSALPLGWAVFVVVLIGAAGVHYLVALIYEAGR